MQQSDLVLEMRRRADDWRRPELRQVEGPNDLKIYGGTIADDLDRWADEIERLRASKPIAEGATDNGMKPLTGDALRSAVDQYCATTNDAPVERALRKLEAAATLVTEWLDRVNDRDGSALGGPQWFELGRAIAVARAALTTAPTAPVDRSEG